MKRNSFDIAMKAAEILRQYNIHGDTDKVKRQCQMEFYNNGKLNREDAILFLRIKQIFDEREVKKK